MNNAAMTIYIQAVVQSYVFSSLAYISWSGVVRSYGVTDRLIFSPHPPTLYADPLSPIVTVFGDKSFKEVIKSNEILKMGP